MDGYWLDWSTWSECSVTCATGSQSRNRTCVEPMYGGAECDGDAEETKECVQIECPGEKNVINVTAETINL